jgi:hypothetical protein
MRPISLASGFLDKVYCSKVFALHVSAKCREVI